jgi:hypothetical protein
MKYITRSEALRGAVTAFCACRMILRFLKIRRFAGKMKEHRKVMKTVQKAGKSKLI